RGAYDFMHKAQLSQSSFERLVRLAAVQADTVRSLRRSQARLQAIVDAEPECVKVLDRRGNLIEMNPAGLRMVEAESLDAVRGHCVFPLVVPDQREAFQGLVRRVADGGEGSMEFEVVWLKGGRRWLHTHMVPLQDEASGERLVLGITRDVTVQKRAERERTSVEQALRESETRFRRTFELAASGIAHIGMDRRFIRVNRRLCEILGYAESELLGLTGRQISHPDDLDVINEQRPQLYAGEIDAVRLEKRYLRKDGAVVWVTFTVTLQRDAAGKPQYEIAVFDDITARKQAEEALRESEARFRSLVALSSDFYWETDAEHRVVHTTRDQKYRPTGDPVIGRTRWDRPSIRPDEAGWAAHRAALEARLPFHDFEIERVDADGERRYRALSGEPMFGAQGEFLGYRGVGRDTTERRREERSKAMEHAVTRCLAEADTEATALRAVLRAICESEQWDCGRYLGADGAGVLRLVESWTAPGSGLEKLVEAARDITIEPGVGLAGHVWQAGEPIWIADVRSDPRARPRVFAPE